ncbi:MAG: hypothetical protein QF774_08385 [Nitrospinota bacterium]|nr:hypothetical protein [Nitrospinota bacterium]
MARSIPSKTVRRLWRPPPVLAVIAAAGDVARPLEALGRVLEVVPLVDIVLALFRYVGPDGGDGPGFGQAH